MHTKLPENIQNEISSRIKQTFDTKEIILFGSYANGNPTADNDIDLLVVLNKKGISRTLKDKLNNRMAVTGLFRDIKKNYPMDILVYSTDEWEILRKSGSSFFKEISEGISII